MALDPTSIETHSAETRTFEPSPEFVAKARCDRAKYDELYKESLESPETFWKRETRDLVFRKPWDTLLDWDLPHSRWFVGAELNASESCIDRHLKTDVKDKPALIWESEPGETRTVTYGQLHDEVVRLASVLRSLGVNKGDRVAIYMGMVPEAAVAMLACARIGAPHTVVFGGFAAESLRDRINDCSAKVVLTQDGALRRGNVVPLKAIVDKALEATPSIEKVLVYRRLGEEKAKIDMKPGRDLDWKEALASADPKLGEAPEIVDAEHPLFILYTSGSTGKPKGA
jgi:acetyl-CoA synthetase